MKCLDIADRILEKISHRADNAEVFVSDGTSFAVEITDGKIETITRSQHSGTGIRIIKGKKLGFAYSSGFAKENTDLAIESAFANGMFTEPDESLSLPEDNGKHPDCEHFDENISRMSVQEKVDTARRLEQTAKEYDARIAKVERATYQDFTGNTAVANSNGMRAAYKETHCTVSLTAVAESGGDVQCSGSMQWARGFHNLNAEKIGTEAASRAVSLLGGKVLATKMRKIILDPMAGVELISLVALMLSADAVQKGKSLLAGKTGMKIAAEIFVLVDDGTLENGAATAPFDGEGVMSSRKVMIENGILKKYLHNVYTGNKSGGKSTGNGVRMSFRGLPEVGPTNFFVMPGSRKPEDVLSRVKNGIYVMDILGLHLANPVSGDFSIGISGRIIENGQLTGAVRGMVMAGNLTDLLSGISDIGSDLTFYGNFGSPTLFLGEFMVSGND